MQEGRGGVSVWWLHGALAALLVGTLGLHLRLDVQLLPAILTAFLIFTLPVLTVAQLPLLGAGLDDRPGVYVGSAVTLVLVTMVALVVGALGPGLAAMGLGPTDVRLLGRGVLQLAGATALLLGLFLLVGRLGGIPESPLLVRLLPRTPHERRLFVGLALVAGFGEEVVFRGFLIAVLTPALGDPWTAILASSLAFGVLHAYQGPFGILRTAILGGLLGASLVGLGSLWPAVVIHAAVDLVGGLVLGPRLLPDPDDAGGT